MTGIWGILKHIAIVLAESIQLRDKEVSVAASLFSVHSLLRLTALLSDLLSGNI